MFLILYLALKSRFQKLYCTNLLLSVIIQYLRWCDLYEDSFKGPFLEAEDLWVFLSVVIEGRKKKFLIVFVASRGFYLF